MKGFWRYWGLGLALGIIFLGGPGGISPVQADGMDRKRPRGSDFQVFQVELITGGAFKFYSDSEDTLRSGDFEQAFSRYLFLASHIRGQSMYAGLAASVNRRLHFLMGQLGLGEESLQYARTTRRISMPAPPPPAPKPEPKPPPAAKPTEDQESPPAAVIPGAKPGEMIRSRRCSWTTKCSCPADAREPASPGRSQGRQGSKGRKV
jgi:hypothetical protein